MVDLLFRIQHEPSPFVGSIQLSSLPQISFMTNKSSTDSAGAIVGDESEPIFGSRSCLIGMNLARMKEPNRARDIVDLDDVEERGRGGNLWVKESSTTKKRGRTLVTELKRITAIS